MRFGSATLTGRDRSVELVKLRWMEDPDATVGELELELDYALRGQRPAPDARGVDWSAFFLPDPVR